MFEYDGGYFVSFVDQLVGIEFLVSKSKTESFDLSCFCWYKCCDVMVSIICRRAKIEINITNLYDGTLLYNKYGKTWLAFEQKVVDW